MPILEGMHAYMYNVTIRDYHKIIDHVDLIGLL